MKFSSSPQHEERAITSENKHHLYILQLEAEAFKLPLAEQKLRGRWSLTVDFVYTSVDDIGVAVEIHVANTKALPISKQADKILANFTTTDLKAESLGSRLDV